ncbi:MAG: adenosylmethionine decarboxylase [Candidatus Methanomethylicia archaeon]|nr:adenosylmethionine decarboxylase [Candidatus Methanomethylicia archaeon]
MSQRVQLEKQIVGKHVYGNLYGCEHELINDEVALKNIVIEAAKIANMTIWDAKSWKFGGEKGGVSALALVLESHIAIHTWNEFQYVAVDVFTCGEKSDPERAFEYIVSKLKPRSVIKHFANRSS